MIRLPFIKKINSNTLRPVVLLVLDGFGIAPDSVGNAISQSKMPNMDFYKTAYPYGSLIASGESVGLPANEAGNSEVGHLTIGAGRTVDQSLVHINKSIKDETFFENKAFIEAVNHVRTNNSKLHIMGLVGSGSVHSDIEHFYALIEFCLRQNIHSARFHLFTDGRDAPPKDGINVIAEIESRLNQMPVGQIKTLAGRYYAMDRDARWDRTKLVYDALVMGHGPRSSTALEAMKNNYANNITDEFIPPTVIGEAGAADLINDNDAVIFFNFRIDRPRQLTMSFVLSNFETIKKIEFGHVPHNIKLDKTTSEGPTFTREKVPANLFFATMTEYQKNLPVSAIAYPPPIVINSMPEVLSKAGLRQMHIAESEKERMVTFYMDGLKETPYENEEVVIVPSPKVPTYDKMPEMNVAGIVREFKKAITKDIYHFICMNFANPDMVAHSGNIDATKKALSFTDNAVGEVVAETLRRNGYVLITADHGNCEEMLTFDKTSFYYTTQQGQVNTEHSNNPVPVYIIGNDLKTNVENGVIVSDIKFNINGSLSDVAPTILALLNLPKPEVMTGKNLLASQS
ncbi:2,3-bisphosphoglycerate-independent phosphoglycerate mutase [Candidatus Woesebacteria bacterium]|nr:MAG: 2,3-bisphosphoglycerate-independent phosphoglycerate mutase [Candidatus Woesebacteria bacterium]